MFICFYDTQQWEKKSVLHNRLQHSSLLLFFDCVVRYYKWMLSMRLKVQYVRFRRSTGKSNTLFIIMLSLLWNCLKLNIFEFLLL